MSTIVTRAVKGSVLSWTEADANFNNLNTDKIQVSTITATAGKTPAVDADVFPIVDSVDDALNKITWADIKATLKTYFDTLYAKVGAITSSGITMSTARLIGRTTGAVGAPEEITVGSGLSLLAGSLTSPVMTSTVSGLVPTPPNNTTTFLRGDGTFAAPSTAGITLGTPVASTSSTSIDFTSIPATAKRITVNFKGVSTSGSSNVVVQIGDSDGVENTGYLGGGLGINSAMGGTGANATDGFPLDMNHGASSLLHGSMVISMESSVNNTWCSMSIVSVTTGGFYVLFGSGSKSLSGVLDRVRITTQGGSDTFDAGEINISYE